MNQVLSLEPIGVFHSQKKNKYELPRQPSSGGLDGKISLFPGKNFEQALEGLEEFERIWVFFIFHKSTGWRPKVLPTRFSSKIGVFATRAPYRPNSIGLSCVKLKEIKGRNLSIEGGDLLDGTPILDIKPYIPYSDSFPDAKAGWVDRLSFSYEISFSDLASLQKRYLEDIGVTFSQSAFDSLRHFSGPNHYNRIKRISEDLFLLAYKDWRFEIKKLSDQTGFVIEKILSGFDITTNDLRSLPEPHVLFLERFPCNYLPKG